MKNKDRGNSGEKFAADYLVKKGYKIIERNKRLGRYEIDIIAQKKKTLCFFEVKTRSENSWDSNLDSWGKKQKHRFLKAVKIYLTENDLWYKIDIRLDFISIDCISWDIVHIENAICEQVR